MLKGGFDEFRPLAVGVVQQHVVVQGVGRQRKLGVGQQGRAADGDQLLVEEEIDGHVRPCGRRAVAYGEVDVVAVEARSAFAGHDAQVEPGMLRA